jgi:C_GCAxxG_C_C family probable redox protein
MLSALINQGYGEKEDLNCAEKILYAANQVYGLGLSREALKLAAGFGSGMAIEDKCGALTASIMVLGKMFVRDRAHESTKIKDLAQELFQEYRKETGSIDCAPLKEKYRTEELKCRYVIFKAAQALEKIVARELAAPPSREMETQGGCLRTKRSAGTQSLADEDDEKTFAQRQGGKKDPNRD